MTTGLRDGIEVKYGTDPLDPDTDGDGLPDGKDVEWIQDVIAGIPNAAIKPPGGGNRNAMLNLLNDAEALLLKGKTRPRWTSFDLAHEHRRLRCNARWQRLDHRLHDPDKRSARWLTCSSPT